MDAAPVLSRGHNVAVFVPPVTGAALPLLQAADKRPMLILAADADRAVSFASWDAVFAVSGLTRAQQRLSAGAPPVLAIGVLDALALMQRSALQPSAFASIVLAWPEQLDEDGAAALENIMAEADKEAQRILLTSDTGATTQKLIERYAFKAMTFGFPPDEKPAGWTPPTPVGGARFVIARATQLEDVKRRVLDALHPSDESALRIALCPVSREAAAALVAEAGEPPVIVVEPHQIPWLRSLFTPLSNLVLPTSSDLAEQRAEKQRARIARVVETENLDRELFILAPLFERHDPAVIAAAALRIISAQSGSAVSAGRGTADAATPTATGGMPSFAKVWVGVGRKDNVKPGDLVGAIVNEAKVKADALGKIEVRDLFCLVEVRSDHAEEVARGLTGVMIRGRRLTARVDRGPGAGARPPRRT